MGILKYLLDTHTLLWAVRDDTKLGNSAREVLSDINTQIFVSAVSAYEIMYKHHLGKMQDFKDIADDYFNVIEQLSVVELPINMRHAHFAGTINWTHRDPFDRLLVAQAHVENMIMITDDTAIKSLPWVNTLW
ncbi:MAG: type II toxin-antitoxin system VapC family toxin [Oscillospiraceae bacterium]|nr:type II toxin-antitoxin system VapC family toxin [Oscillospiraceae bacterium]